MSSNIYGSRAPHVGEVKQRSHNVFLILEEKKIKSKTLGKEDKKKVNYYSKLKPQSLQVTTLKLHSYLDVGIIRSVILFSIQTIYTSKLRCLLDMYI